MAAKFVTGIDIGLSSIKAVTLSHKESPQKLISFGSVASPQPGIISDSDLDLEAVGTAVKNLVEELDPPTKDVIIALPESRIFTRVVYDLPYLSNDELAQAIKYATEEFVPMNIEQVNLNYQIIYRSPQKAPDARTVVFIVASPKNVIDKYLKVLSVTDLKPLAIETELIGSVRSLISFNPQSPPTLLIQLGALTTDFATVSEGFILLTRSIATGGIAMSRALSQSLNFEPLQAEEYKKTYGILENQLEGKLFQILKPIIDVIVAEARKVIQAHEAQNPTREIKRVVLTGGGAQMPGLVIYIATNLGLEVQEGDPFLSLSVDPSIKKKLSSSSSMYSVAAGLAMREI